jgi:hypothetical protein
MNRYIVEKKGIDPVRDQVFVVRDSDTDEDVFESTSRGAAEGYADEHNYLERSEREDELRAMPGYGDPDALHDRGR